MLAGGAGRGSAGRGVACGFFLRGAGRGNFFAGLYEKIIGAASVTAKKVTCFQNVEKEGCPQGMGGGYFFTQIRGKIRQPSYEDSTKDSTGIRPAKNGEHGKFFWNGKGGEWRGTREMVKPN